MVSGKPPRHSRQKDEPVTIDLEAEAIRAEPVAEGMAETAPEAPAMAGDATTPELGEAAAPSPVGADVDRVEEPAQPVPEGLDQSEALRDADPTSVPGGETDGLPSDAQTDATAKQTANEARDASAAAPSGTTTVPPVTPRPASAEKTGSTTSSLLAASILGGLIALVGAGALQYGGLLPALGPDRGTSQNDTAALSAEIDQLRSQIAGLPAAGAPASNPQIESRLAALEQTIRAAQPDTAEADSQAIETLRAEQDETREAIASLRTDLAAARQAVADEKSASDARIAALQKKVDEPRNDIAMAKAIALSSLKTAVDRGGPFLGELDTLSGISPDDPTVAALKPFAATGIPSRAELLRRFQTVADQILEAVHQPGADANWGDRLLSSALSVVKVRPVGNVEGDGPDAIVARMEDKLRNGDLKGAAIEWQGLPEDGKKASADFVKSIEDRVTVETAVNAALAQAVSEKS